LNGSRGVAPTPLWDQKFSTATSYTFYQSPTMTNAGVTTNGTLTLGTNSTLCLSCHDGTVAVTPGNLVPYGTVPMTGSMNPQDVLTATDIAAMHPINFNLPICSSSDVCASLGLVSNLANKPPTTGDTTGKVHLIGGNIQCGTCHNPHVEYVNLKDTSDTFFLVMDNSGGNLCLTCHTPNNVPAGSGMGTNPISLHQGVMQPLGEPASKVSRPNPLAGWSTSIHAMATNRVAHQITMENTTMTTKGPVTNKAQSSLGNYGSVARNACSSCHATHNAQGAHSLLRAADDQACVVCHNGSSNTSPPTANILAETVAPKYGHALAVGNSPHLQDESALLSHPHVTCVDCHNPHSTQREVSFNAPPAIRLSQGQVIGISASDGKTVVTPAINQYENCLRCHGTSTSKPSSLTFGYLPVWAVAAPDPLNVIPQFNLTATSSHPVFHDSNSPYPQPSLRVNMLQLDGMTIGRGMGTRILCTDCHNSDDNREFGGSGPNGPHGSIFPHILERRYEFSQAGAPGRAVANLFPNPSLSAQGGASGGPYALCAKCHDLNQIMNNTSFSEHARHIKQDGFSCSVCHTAHGMGTQTGSISGERLVNFDVRTVAPNGGAPISYNRATNSCSLVCHNHSHQLRTAGGAGKR
jgi:predicted CXXCH cytochrome family protein